MRGQRNGGDQEKKRVAVSLMRMALALLDRSGEAAAAARLRSAIAVVGQDSDPIAVCSELE